MLFNKNFILSAISAICLQKAFIYSAFSDCRKIAEIALFKILSFSHTF